MSYSHAVISPFDGEALGAQVPDPYGFPTSTTHFRVNTSIYPDALGNFDFIVQPNLLATVYTNNSGSIIGMPSDNNYTNTYCTVTNTPNITGNGQSGRPSMSGIVSYSDLSDLADQFRIVGMGVRFESEMLPTAATGTLSICSNPCNPMIPTAEWFQNAGNGAAGSGRAAILNYLNFPQKDNDNYTSTQIITYPTGMKMTALDWHNSGLEWETKIVSSEAYNWRDGSNTTSNAATTLNQNMGDFIVTTSTSGIGSVKERSYYINGGFSYLVVRGVGFPHEPEGVSSPLIGNLEIIFHVEYINATLANNQNAKFPPVNSALLTRTAETHSQLPLYSTVTNKSDARIIQKAITRIGL